MTQPFIPRRAPMREGDYPVPAMDAVFVHNASGIRVRVVGKVGVTQMLCRHLDGPRAGQTHGVSCHWLASFYTEQKGAEPCATSSGRADLVCAPELSGARAHTLHTEREGER